MPKAEVYRVRAVNSAADSENKIHDNAIAAAYGFQGGLAPGVTIYGYMMMPVLEHFGAEWLERGRAQVRFQSPVYEGEQVAVESRALPEGQLELSLDGGRATGLAWMDASCTPPDAAAYDTPPIPELRPLASRETLEPGTALGALSLKLDLAQARMSAPLPAAIGEPRYAHPAILLALANDLFVRNFRLGPWIHTASRIANFAPAVDGDALEVRGRVAERYERKGHELVNLDVLIVGDGRPVLHVLNTAIWKPRKS